MAHCLDHLFDRFRDVIRGLKLHVVAGANNALVAVTREPGQMSLALLALRVELGRRHVKVIAVPALSSCEHKKRNVAERTPLAALRATTRSTRATTPLR